ncbi:MAG TPA: hypothetical protein VGP33_13510 [Chloroflexota bacterium]|nr:hypothetical protein [Chloroflexota bacterium]
MFQALSNWCSALLTVAFIGEFRTAIRKVADDFRTLVQFDEL